MFIDTETRSILNMNSLKLNVKKSASCQKRISLVYESNIIYMLKLNMLFFKC